MDNDTHKKPVKSRYEILAEALSIVYKDSGLTQVQLSEITGLNRTILSGLMAAHPHRSFSEYNLKKLGDARALDFLGAEGLLEKAAAIAARGAAETVDDKTAGAALGRVYRAEGYTEPRLAAKTGMHETHISKLVNGNRRFTDRALTRLGSVLHFSGLKGLLEKDALLREATQGQQQGNKRGARG